MKLIAFVLCVGASEWAQDLSPRLEELAAADFRTSDCQGSEHVRAPIRHPGKTRSAPPARK